MSEPRGDNTSALIRLLFLIWAVMHSGTLPNKGEHLDYHKLITKWLTHSEVRCSLGIDKEEELYYFVLAFVLELAVVP